MELSQSYVSKVLVTIDHEPWQCFIPLKGLKFGLEYLNTCYETQAFGPDARDIEELFIVGRSYRLQLDADGSNPLSTTLNGFLQKLWPISHGFLLDFKLDPDTELELWSRKVQGAS